MKTYRAYTFSARDLAESVANQEVVQLTIGRSRAAKLYVLPLASWRKQVHLLYGPPIEDLSPRLPTHTGPNGINETALFSIILDQTDEFWQPSNIAILTLDRADAAYLVPANPFWRSHVEKVR